MSAATPTDPLEQIPDPAEVRDRLGANTRERRILQRLLKLADDKREHERITSQATRGSAAQPAMA